MPDNLPAFEFKPLPVTPITSFGVQIDPAGALRNCEIGKSFVVDTNDHRQRIIGYAARLKFKIKTKRRPDDRYDVWKIK